MRTDDSVDDDSLGGVKPGRVQARPEKSVPVEQSMHGTSTRAYGARDEADELVSNNRCACGRRAEGYDARRAEATCETCARLRTDGSDLEADARHYLDGAGDQLETAAEKADTDWLRKAIEELRVDLAKLQGFQTAAELRGDRDDGVDRGDGVQTDGGRDQSADVTERFRSWDSLSTQCRSRSPGYTGFGMRRKALLNNDCMVQEIEQQCNGYLCEDASVILTYFCKFANILYQIQSPVSQESFRDILIPEPSSERLDSRISMNSNLSVRDLNRVHTNSQNSITQKPNYRFEALRRLLCRLAYNRGTSYCNGGER